MENQKWIQEQKQKMTCNFPRQRGYEKGKGMGMEKTQRMTSQARTSSSLKAQTLVQAQKRGEQEKGAEGAEEGVCDADHQRSE